MKKFKLQHSAGVSFIPTPLFPEFDGNCQTILVPTNAFSWNYVFSDPDWYLCMDLNISKCSLPSPPNQYLKLWLCSISSSGSFISGPFIWATSHDHKSIKLINEQMLQSHIVLYACYDINNNIISKFQRFYVNKDHNDITYPYDTQLFKACYAKPFTFILVPPVCGFFGSFADLFGDFIALWEQGIIHN
jgi:hypothetical protein